MRRGKQWAPGSRVPAAAGRTRPPRPEIIPPRMSFHRPPAPTPGGAQPPAVDPEILEMTDEQLEARIRAIRMETDTLSREVDRYAMQVQEHEALIKSNKGRIQASKRLPLLVATVSELVDVDERQYEHMDVVGVEFGGGEARKAGSSSGAAAGAAADASSGSAGKPADEDGEGVIRGIILKTSMRQNIFLERPGLIPRGDLRPNDIVAANKDTFFVYERLPQMFDTRVKQMEVVERPTDTFDDLGGIGQQISELKEALLLPLERPDLFKKVGIRPCKGVLLYGVPGSGKTACARALANAANCAYLQLCATQLIQTFLGDGSAMVIDAFDLAKSLIAERRAAGDENAGCIIFIDELDAIGTRRLDNDGKGDREVSRTLLTLLNCMDGFDSNDRVKVLASTNRVDVLDPALTRSGRFDKKIEYTNPNERGREEILRIHSRKMAVCTSGAGAVNFAELAKAAPDYSGAMLKQACMEAGLVCLRRKGQEVTHEDFVEGIASVGRKVDGDVFYFV